MRRQKRPSWFAQALFPAVSCNWKRLEAATEGKLVWPAAVRYGGAVSKQSHQARMKAIGTDANSHECRQEPRDNKK